MSEGELDLLTRVKWRQLYLTLSFVVSEIKGPGVRFGPVCFPFFCFPLLLLLCADWLKTCIYSNGVFRFRSANKKGLLKKLGGEDKIAVTPGPSQESGKWLRFLGTNEFTESHYCAIPTPIQEHQQLTALPVSLCLLGVACRRRRLYPAPKANCMPMHSHASPTTGIASPSWRKSVQFMQKHLRLTANQAHWTILYGQQLLLAYP